MEASTPVRFGSRLARILASGTFAVTAEVTPNASGSPDQVLAQVRAMRGYADAFNVTDCTRALVRISSLAASALLLRDGVEPVTQMVTRDRNRIALQADVLGAHALGVRNLLCLRGDDPKVGNEPDAAPVFEYTTEQFLALAKKLRETGALAGGEVVQDPPRMFLGAAANPFGASPEEAVVNLRGKVDAGADFIQTQAVHDVVGFEEWMRLVRKEWLHDKVHILAGVIPLRSAKMARFLDEKVAGIAIPTAVKERMARAADPKAEGVRIALETVETLRAIEGIRGIHLMAVGWEDVVPTIVTKAGLHPRPTF